MPGPDWAAMSLVTDARVAVGGVKMLSFAAAAAAAAAGEVSRPFWSDCRC